MNPVGFTLVTLNRPSPDYPLSSYPLPSQYLRSGKIDPVSSYLDVDMSNAIN